MSNKKKLWLAIFALVVIVFGVFTLLEARRDAEEAARFEPYLNEYTSNTISDNYSIGGEPYIKNKIIMVDIDEKKFDNSLFHSSLMELKATTPEEVGTVIWLSWDEEIADHYTDGTAAIRLNCFAQIIDITESSIIGEKLIYGSSPPSSKAGSGSRTGSKPDTNVIEYIKTLPRR